MTADQRQIINLEEIINRAQVQSGMHIAELGCGSQGYFILPLARLIGNTGKAYAVDVQKNVLEGVRSKAKLEGIVNLETVWSNLETIGATNISANSLDVALLINVLHQNKAYSAILQECGRLLKKGGRLIIVDWKKTGTPFGPDLAIRVDQQEVEDLAEELNYHLLESSDVGAYFWGLILEKV